jgi:hypothetical protein
MKERLKKWLDENSRLPGVLACGVRFSDKSCESKSFSETLIPERLDETWQSLSDVPNFLRMHRIPVTRLRWSYDDAQVHFTCRADGICLGLLSVPRPSAAEAESVERLLAEFLGL